MPTTTTPLRFVKSPADVIASALNWQGAVANRQTLVEPMHRDLFQCAAMTRSWIAIEDNGDFIYAPSKFVGYVGMNIDTYSENRITMSAGYADRVLRGMTTPAQPGSKAEQGWVRTLQQQGLTINAGARLSVLTPVAASTSAEAVPPPAATDIPGPDGGADDASKAATGSTPQTMLVEHVFGLFTLLPPEGQAEVKQRINALRR